MILPADLRLRIAVLALSVAALSSLARAAPSAAYFSAALTLFALYRGSWRRLLRLEAMVAMLLATLPFVVKGAPAFRLGPLIASEEGLARALILGLKISAATMVFSACFQGVQPIDLGRALRGLALPEPLVRVFLGLIRALDLFRCELTRLQEAMRMRSFRPRSNWHTWRSYGNLIGMVLLRALLRAERVEEAMRLRAGGSRARMLAAPKTPILRTDYPRAALILLAACALLLWDSQ